MLKQTLALIGLTLSLGANADILFENPFPTSLTTGVFSGGSYRVYDSFSLSSDSVLDEFQFSTAAPGYLPTEFSVTIYSDASFSNVLFTRNYLADNDDVVQQAGSGGAINLLVSLPDITLSAGEYWISPFTVSGNTLAINVTDPTIDGSMVQDYNKLGADMAMRVYGNSISEVPIPAAAWLFGSALLGLGLVKRKQA